jgi:hypothetical protein
VLAWAYFVAGGGYVPESGHAACSSSRQPPSRGLQCRKRSCKRRPWRYQGVAAVLPVGSATFATSRTFEPSNACMALKRLCVGVRVELSMTGVGQWERAQQCSIASAALTPVALLRRSGSGSRRAALGGGYSRLATAVRPSIQHVACVWGAAAAAAGACFDGGGAIGSPSFGGSDATNSLTSKQP